MEVNCRGGGVDALMSSLTMIYALNTGFSEWPFIDINKLIVMCFENNIRIEDRVPLPHPIEFCYDYVQFDTCRIGVVL